MNSESIESSTQQVAEHTLELGLQEHAERVQFTEEFARCFKAVASSHFGSGVALEEVCSQMRAGPVVWDIVNRFVLTPTDEMSGGLRTFIGGSCAGYVQSATAPGVAEAGLRSASAGRLEMDRRGRLMLNQAIRLGLVRVNGPALNWYRRGWMMAVNHWQNCVVSTETAGKCG